MTEWKHTTPSHALHLFNVMQNHKVLCGAEIRAGQADPIMGLSDYQPVSVDCVLDCAPEDQTMIVVLGEAEFSFNLNSHRFDYDISEQTIDIIISSECLSVQFSTVIMRRAVLDEARAFDPDFNDKVIHMDIGSKHFEEAFQFLTDLIREGRVIKAVKVLGDGNQVLTVGYVGKVSS
ncbi:hypothetical protein ABIE27_006008 [Paenibacillus sp. 4624]|uniref:hypothetical protein n=1 Tax=Paenibacillus sp. 4624 TaxID=3156453 RepID=UPI003D1A71EE